MISSRKPNSICAVIPIYNEAAHLDSVIPEVHKYTDHLICVDDGSTDSTHEELERYKYVKVISLDKNMGKGKALFYGLSESIKLGSEITITLDADGQHDPSLISSFISKLESNDLVLGNRMNNLNKMPPQRIVSNTITSWLLTKKLGVKIIDSQSGFRAYKTNALKDILPESSGFEAETEMLIKAGKKKLKIGHINIPTIYNENKSKIKPIRTILGFIKVYLRY
ncbi:hypothetical protein MNBD_IGNAVI01-724 [hydrothermal vent metagenome]|uniref:Glycosyltransferase 2-like domain-containing protein n=1 Tax=hydrothermal vent metagenome TaxID=652676 RepID=A0A3B1BYG1_9ZZZZ